ncbi:MAG: hypothetical protein MZU97_19435 [Bacillus subtilis]|nr:hypothetical protein [Bacillus subtilis]
MLDLRPRHGPVLTMSSTSELVTVGLNTDRRADRATIAKLRPSSLHRRPDWPPGIGAVNDFSAIDNARLADRADSSGLRFGTLRRRRYRTRTLPAAAIDAFLTKYPDDEIVRRRRLP